MRALPFGEWCVYAYSDLGVQRTLAKNKMWSPMFVVSHDGGKTFGPNVHPYAKGRKRETEYAPFSGDALAVHSQLRSIQLNSSALLLTSCSVQVRRQWQDLVGPTVSKRFEVFAPEVVEAKRNAAANGRGSMQPSMRKMKPASLRSPCWVGVETEKILGQKMA